MYLSLIYSVHFDSHPLQACTVLYIGTLDMLEMDASASNVSEHKSQSGHSTETLEKGSGSLADQKGYTHHSPFNLS